MNAFGTAVRTFLRVALPFFRSEQRWRARGLLIGVIAAFGAAVALVVYYITGEAGVDVQVAPLVAGMLAALVAGLAAIAILLRFLRTHPTTIFILYRLVLACVVVVA